MWLFMWASLVAMSKPVAAAIGNSHFRLTGRTASRGAEARARVNIDALWGTWLAMRQQPSELTDPSGSAAAETDIVPQSKMSQSMQNFMLARHLNVLFWWRSLPRSHRENTSDSND